MLGITSYTKKVMRLAVIISVILGALSFGGLIASLVLDILGFNITAIYYFGCGIFLFLSVILFFIGLSSEYVMMINQRTLKRPLVIEEKRINFDK